MRRCSIKSLFLLVTLLSFLVISNSVFAKDTYTCGLANGYPPYQFKENEKATGFDTGVIKAIFENIDAQLKLSQTEWDTVVGSVRFGKIDCAIGMGINDTRKMHFDFTIPYYERKSAVFILKSNNQIKSIEDLDGKLITGDRHSFVEVLLKEKGLKPRMKQTKSKEESMRLLKSGRFQAVIAPKAFT